MPTSIVCRVSSLSLDEEFQIKQDEDHQDILPVNEVQNFDVGEDVNIVEEDDAKPSSEVDVDEPIAIKREKQSSAPLQKVINAMKKLDSDFNEIAHKIVEEAKAKVDQAHEAGNFETVANKMLNFLIDIVDLDLSAEFLLP